jgi:tetratricopeptide (TPR) repeat protein
MTLARSHEEASPRTFVHVDGSGQVRSPARYRTLQALSFTAAGMVVGGVTVIYAALLGPAGLAIGGGLAVYLGWSFRRVNRLQKATALIVHDRLDEAEQILESILRSFRCPRSVRALCEQNLGSIAARRGQYEEALTHQRAAMALYARSRRRSPMRQVVEYAEVITLVNLDRVGEARQRLDQKHGKVPDGDYLRMQHWAAELYVCLGEGEHPLDADALHERARAALKVTGAAALLGLCAWAHERSGDRDQAWHLLREAYDRKEGLRLERALPRLYEWMEAHGVEAGAIDPSFR